MHSSPKVAAEMWYTLMGFFVVFGFGGGIYVAVAYHDGIAALLMFIFGAVAVLGFKAATEQE